MEDGTQVDTSGTLLQGVGDEVSIALSAVVTCVTVGSILWWFVFGIQSQHNEAVHPEQRTVVDRARARLQVTGDALNGVQATNERVPQSVENDEEHDVDSAEIPQCPICLSSVTYPTETNCGHIFCGECILAYWHADRWPQACRCAVCRREVNLLLPNQGLSSLQRYQTIRTRVADYNQRMSGEYRPFMSYIQDIPVLLHHLWRDLFTYRGLRCIQRIHICLILAFLLCYLLLPVDIIPELALGVLGMIDDIVILAGVIVYITLIYRNFVTNRGVQ